MRIAITGSSGLIGSALVPRLVADGHEVVRLVRRPPSRRDEVRWEPERGLDPTGTTPVDAVVHLAGENIAGGRWTAARKAKLRSSRVGPTRRLAESLAAATTPPRVLVSSSAIGYYGNRGSAWLDESSPPADDFLGRLSVEWEQATQPAADAGVRVVRLRTGIVLTPAGGALAKMLPAFRAGVAGVLGRGTQYFSWIALDDVIGAFVHVLGHEALSGPVNAVAPEPVTNRDFTKTLGRVLGRPTLTAVPAFALRLALGEMADATLLSSARVRPRRLMETGFAFRFPQVEAALRHALGKAPA